MNIGKIFKNRLLKNFNVKLVIQCINMQVSSFIAVYKLFKSRPFESILGAPGGVQHLTEGIYVYRLESSNITS